MAAKRTRARRNRRPRPAWIRDRRTAMIVVLSVVAVVLFSVLVPLHGAAYGSPIPVTMLLGAAAVAAPLVSMRRPNLAMMLFTAAALLIPLTVPRSGAVTAPWPWSVPMLLAFAVIVAAITFQHGWRPGLVQLVLGTAAGLIASIMLPEFPSANSLIVTTSVVGGLYVLAVLLAGRLRLGEELTQERANTAQEQARRELVEERTRIARELHDVVAHSMSLIQVQAATARYRVPDLQQDAATEFDDIAATARTALAEMRRILGVLRTEDHTAELAPQRGVDDIPALVETSRRAGASIALAQAVDGDVSPATQIAAYRIVQEAISNAVRHAPGSEITVSVTAGDDAVAVTVRNGAAASPSPGAGAGQGHGGHGLRGMSERATLLGGTVQAGPDGDGWTVSAVLPRHPVSPAPEGTT
ncbi:sensor histidine kinase [Microbacterium sp. SD291]|uniref:sensor histidine kinase n=1 Tax=Microbacterium sp. SD291 TaxID=2782007 RepID=UPI001A957179|nr:histidine kinase [Microbacterium sp. SD291]MBO0979201.1 sensor histidine kinase [Microbacterium sp. SD291]